MHFTHQPIAARRGIGSRAVRQVRPVARILARILGVVGGATMLAGCLANQETITPAAFDYRLRHPIAIKEGAHTVELFIGGGRGGLNGEQRADVISFANRWRREATGGILIDLPSGTRNEVAAAGAVREVRSLLTAAGVPESAIDVRPYRPSDPVRLATVKLNYPTMVAEAGPCGTWPRDLGPTLDRDHNENTEYFNFGCATQRNLAAMADNKADLVQPRGEVPPYTGRRTTALDKYRRGETTQAVNPDKDQGKISDLGK
jgi:pilus assembly protein CpaD